jgi:nucleotide-binding universal stress UspA family protein
MYRKILVPLDGSPLAESILPYVEDIARCDDRHVTFLQVLEPVASSLLMGNPEMSVYIADAERQQERDAGRYLEGQCNDFRQRTGAEARTLIARGSVVSAIVETANSEDVDLIAMASHGRTGLSRAIFGSVATGVLHNTHRPMLLIHPEEPAKN